MDSSQKVICFKSFYPDAEAAKLALKERVQQMSMDELRAKVERAEYSQSIEAVMREAKKQRRNRRRYVPETWRDQARYTIPTYLITRGILSLIYRPNHPLLALGDWLERRRQLLDDISSPLNGVQRMQLSLWRWLCEAPNSVLQSTPEKTHLDPSSPPTSHPAQVSEQVSLEREGLGHEK